MALKMDIDRLAQDELKYELDVRGFDYTGTVDQLRKRLRQVLRNEKEGHSFDQPPTKWDLALETEYVERKIKEVTNLIADVVDSKTESAYKKAETKLAHLFGRLARFDAADESAYSFRSKISSIIMDLSADLEAKVSVTEVVDQGTEPSAPLPQDLPINLSFLNLNEENVQSNVEAPQIEPITLSAGFARPVPVEQWGISFNGEPGSLSVAAFLERVEELRLARGISEVQLWNSAIDLFSGSAAIWFRSVRRTITSWHQLCVLLREYFQPFDYNEHLFEEIKRRTQGPNESFHIYIAVMINLFSRLGLPMAEQSKLKIILNNILPWYQDRLSLVDITSIDQLIQLGRRLEARRLTTHAFQSPPACSSKLLEPDLGYKCSRTQRSAQVSVVSEERSPSQLELSSKNKPPLACWNCSGKGHGFRNCSSRLNTFCFACGKKGVVKPQCPRCSPRNYQQKNDQGESSLIARSPTHRN